MPPAGANALLLRLVPRCLLRTAIGAVMGRRAVIDDRKCVRCGECERNCPSHAIERDADTGRYRVDSHKCIACYCCTEVCPNDAVAVRRRWLRG